MLSVRIGVGCSSGIQAVLKVTQEDGVLSSCAPVVQSLWCFWRCLFKIQQNLPNTWVTWSSPSGACPLRCMGLRWHWARRKAVVDVPQILHSALPLWGSFKGSVDIKAFLLVSTSIWAGGLPGHRWVQVERWTPSAFKMLTDKIAKPFSQGAECWVKMAFRG